MNGRGDGSRGEAGTAPRNETPATPSLANGVQETLVPHAVPCRAVPPYKRQNVYPQTCKQPELFNCAHGRPVPVYLGRAAISTLRSTSDSALSFR